MGDFCYNRYYEYREVEKAVLFLGSKVFSTLCRQVLPEVASARDCGDRIGREDYGDEDA